LKICVPGFELSAALHLRTPFFEVRASAHPLSRNELVMLRSRRLRGTVRASQVIRTSATRTRLDSL
jgi:hypothetical protein